MRASDVAEFFDIKITKARTLVRGREITKELLEQIAQELFGKPLAECAPRRVVYMDKKALLKLSLRNFNAGFCALPSDIPKNSVDYRRLAKQKPFIKKRSDGTLGIYPYGMDDSCVNILVDAMRRIPPTATSGASFCPRHQFIHNNVSCPVCAVCAITGVEYTQTKRDIQQEIENAIRSNNGTTNHQ